MARIFARASDLIGGTPLVALHAVCKAHGVKARVLAKLECMNPAGSAKDRAARNMIEEAGAHRTVEAGWHNYRADFRQYWNWIGIGRCPAWISCDSDHARNHVVGAPPPDCCLWRGNCN